MTAILPRRLRVHPCLGRRNLLAFLCLYQRKQPPNLPVCDQSASAPMNRNTLGLIVVGSGTLFVVSQELLLSPVMQQYFASPSVGCGTIQPGVHRRSVRSSWARSCGTGGAT